MSNNTATKAPLEEKYNDYEKTPVPETARQTWYQQGMVWLGAGFGLSGLATGGVLADGLSFRDMLLVSIIGSIIITIIGTLNALVSEHTHLSTSFTCRRSFGIKGAVLCVIAVWKTSSMISFSDIWNAGPVSTPITIPMGVAAVVGSFAVGVTMVGDFSRFSKSKRDCMIGVSIGHCWGYIPILMCGAFFNYAFHNWNIVEIMILSLGLGLFGALVLIIGQWTTNDNNLYTSVLGLMNTLDGISKVPRMRLTLIVGLISTAIAAVGLYKYFVTFLSLLGVFITPIGGILIADFYICNRKNYDGGDVPQGIKWDAIVSWAVASFVGVTMTARPVGLGWFVAVGDVIPVPLICIAVAMVLYVVSQKLQNRKLQNKAGAV